MVVKEVLSIRGLKKSYPGVMALKGVNLAFKAGEIHGLIGENGAGKSTLIKILAGIVKPDDGEVTILGKSVQIRNSKDSSRNRLCFIHQELNLVTYFNAAENIFLGHSYPRRLRFFVDWKRLKAKTKEITDALQVRIPLDTPVSYLSAVDRAMVAIARAFAVSGDIYFMDEPATALTDIEKEKLFRVIKTLKSQGKTVVYVSHNLDDVLDITDRITVMRDGTVVECRETLETTKEDLIRSMIGKSLESAFPSRAGKAGAVVFEARDIHNESIDGLSFDIRAGEVLGLGGLVGAGRTELLETIFGARCKDSGTFTLDGVPFRPSSPRSAIEQGVVLVPEERRKQGLVLSRSIYENISMMSLSDISNFGFLNHRVIRNRSEEAGEDVRLKCSNYSNHVRTLSGGNQQKVVFAKTVLQEPKLLLLDEPSKGVDVGARFEIYSIIRDLASRGTAVIIVSSDFNEVLGLADRILFIKEGKMVSLMNNIDMNQEKYLNCCYGRDS